MITITTTSQTTRYKCKIYNVHRADAHYDVCTIKVERLKFKYFKALVSTSATTKAVCLPPLIKELRRK